MVIFLDIWLEKRKLISTRSWRGCFPLIINKWNVFQWGNALKMLVHPYKRILLIYSVCVWGRWVHTLVSLENIMFSEKVILKGSYEMLFYLFNTFSNRKSYYWNADYSSTLDCCIRNYNYKGKQLKNGHCCICSNSGLLVLTYLKIPQTKQQKP